MNRRLTWKSNKLEYPTRMLNSNAQLIRIPNSNAQFKCLTKSDFLPQPFSQLRRKRASGSRRPSFKKLICSPAEIETNRNLEPSGIGLDSSVTADQQPLPSLTWNRIHLIECVAQNVVNCVLNSSKVLVNKRHRAVRRLRRFGKWVERSKRFVNYFVEILLFDFFLEICLRPWTIEWTIEWTLVLNPAPRSF